MKKSAIVCLLLAFVLVFSTFAMADATLNTVTGTDVTGTDVTGTDVTGTDVLECGDVNGDKAINALDALMILKAAVSKIELTDAQAEAANAYQDEAINALDALYVLRYAVDKIDSLPYIPAGDVVTGTDVTGTDVTPTEA